MSGDGFLSRWAKRKALARQGVEVEADAPHASPLPRAAREQALRGSGLEPPTGQALDPLADRRLAPPADRNAGIALPHGADPEVPAFSLPSADPEATAFSLPGAEPEALAPSPLWGEGRGEGRGRAPSPAAPPKTLADVAALTPDADFTPFLSPQVHEHVKRAALKKLFADPHFNLMDGLDTYIDDYSKSDPIPESMLRRMAQSQALGLFDATEEAARGQAHNGLVPAADPSGDAVSADAAPHPDSDAHVATDAPDVPAQGAPASPDPEASPDGAGFAELTQSAIASQAVPRHEDPDLRLQQDHAAGRGGPGEGASG